MITSVSAATYFQFVEVVEYIGNMKDKTPESSFYKSIYPTLVSVLGMIQHPSVAQDIQDVDSATSEDADTGEEEEEIPAPVSTPPPAPPSSDDVGEEEDADSAPPELPGDNDDRQDEEIDDLQDIVDELQDKI